MPWMPFLLRWWRVGLYGLVALAPGLAIWRVTVWHRAYDELPRLRSALEAEKLCGEGSACAQRVAALSARQDAIKKVVSDYESELESLRNRPVPHRVIRVCRPAGTGGLPDTGAAPGPDGAAPAAGVVLGTDELDTQPLRDLARLADELSARLRALQARDRALS